MTLTRTSTSCHGGNFLARLLLGLWFVATLLMANGGDLVGRLSPSGDLTSALSGTDTLKPAPAPQLSAQIQVDLRLRLGEPSGRVDARGHAGAGHGPDFGPPPSLALPRMAQNRTAARPAAVAILFAHRAGFEARAPPGST